MRLGGSANATFDTTQIAAAGQYQNFGIFVKTGTGTWTLTGTPGQATPWTINQGTLAISSDNNLGTSGETLTFNGGTLQRGAVFTRAHGHAQRRRRHVRHQRLHVIGRLPSAAAAASPRPAPAR